MLSINGRAVLICMLLFTGSASIPAMAQRGMFSDMPTNPAATGPVEESQGIHGQVRGMFAGMPTNPALTNPFGGNSTQSPWNRGSQWSDGEDPEISWRREWRTEREPDGRWERQWSFRWHRDGEDNRPSENSMNSQSASGSGSSGSSANWTPTPYQVQHGYAALPPTTTAPLSLNVVDEGQLREMRERALAERLAEYEANRQYERGWWWTDENSWH